MKTRMKEDNKARLHLADVIYCTGATLTRTRLDKGVLESSGREDNSPLALQYCN